MHTVLARYSIGNIISADPITSGFIHATYRITASTGTYILQRLASIFDERTVRDMERVSAHLAAKGIPAPRLIPGKDGAAWYKDGEGLVWRLMSFIEGATYTAFPRDSYAEEAGRVLAQFHVAMADFDARALESKPILHQPQAFYDAFRGIYGQLTEDESDNEQRGSYQYILEKMPSLMLPSDLPTAVIHGDPKISNIIFRNGEGVCLIDLDTCMEHTPLMDLGDALRWCAISEEAFPNSVSMPRFAASVNGYAGVLPLAPEIREYLPRAFALVTTALASRFAKDVHDDRYFGWDAAAYPSRRAHNTARVKSLVSLARDILEKENEMRKIVARA